LPSILFLGNVAFSAHIQRFAGQKTWMPPVGDRDIAGRTSRPEKDRDFIDAYLPFFM
jgi:hypothetical protein